MSTNEVSAPPEVSPEVRAGVRRRRIQIVMGTVLQAVVLFAAAGRLDWTLAWVYLAGYVGVVVVTSLTVRDPELIAERGKIRADAKAWDKALTVLFSVSGLGMLLVAGLDERFGWSPPSPAGVAAGLLTFVASDALVVWAMASNRFFSALVRIQADRGHAVATGGPYRLVRHPAYLGFIVSGFGAGLLLGSRWALVPAAVTALLLVVRTALEDRTLRSELPGYRDYAARVRYRLLPGAW
jgi:protein-S-isoprenylcysteine O-methyltransferase Ste14